MEENAPHCGSSGNAINDELELSWWYESWRRQGRGNGQQSPLYVACDRQGWELAIRKLHTFISLSSFTVPTALQIWDGCEGSCLSKG